MGKVWLGWWSGGEFGVLVAVFAKVLWVGDWWSTTGARLGELPKNAARLTGTLERQVKEWSTMW